MKVRGLYITPRTFWYTHFSMGSIQINFLVLRKPFGSPPRGALGESSFPKIYARVRLILPNRLMPGNPNIPSVPDMPPRRYAIKSRGSYYDSPAYAARRSASTSRRTSAFSRRMASAAAPRRAARKESGYVDTAAATYAMDTTGTIALLNVVAQGTSVNQRVGKKISMKGLQCRGSSYNNSAAIQNDVAMIIVYDKRPDGNLPAITDILVTATSKSFNNTQNEGRFSILKRIDYTQVGDTTGTQLTSNTANSLDFYLDLKGKPVVYKAAGTGAIGDIEEGALYVVTVGSSGAGVGAAAANVGFRLRYYDQ